VVFAEPTDVETAYEGTLPAGSENRVQYLLDTVSARLRVLLPTLEARVATDDDTALLAKDIVVQAVIRRLPGSSSQNVQSQTQTAGPWSTTVRYTTDTSQTFSDEDLRLLGGVPASLGAGGSVGTIKLKPIEWYYP
jgi:hypothetical protein